MFWNDFGYLLLILVATVICILQYESVQKERVNAYFKRKNLSEEQKKEARDDAKKSKYIVRFLAFAWLAFVIGALLGNGICIILSLVMSLAVTCYLVYSANEASKQRMAVLTFLALPISIFICLLVEKTSGLFLAVILGLIPVVAVRFGRIVSKLIRATRKALKEE